MDKELLQLCRQSNKEAFFDYLNEQSANDIQDLVKRKLQDYNSTGNVDSVSLLRAIIQGSPVEGGNSLCLQRRFIILQNVIEWLAIEDKDNPQKSKQASSVVNLLLPEIELLSPNHLGKAGNMMIDIIQASKPVHTRFFDIFTKVWNVLSTRDEFSILAEMFDGLLEAKWHQQMAVGMASALNDMELSSMQLQQIIKYMIRNLSVIDLEEVPPFIWQLLLISRKGHKPLVLNGILDFFNTVKKNKDISRVEGTVMLHISFALKQDQELGNELIKIMKNDKSKHMEVFNVACLLTAARIHRLQDTIFDLLKSSIISVYRDNDKLLKNYWISKFTKMEEDAFCQVLLEVTDKSASAGWDQIIQSLTQLAILLIDTATNVGSFLVSKSTAVKTRSSHTKEDGPMERLSKFGLEILLRLFKYHDIVRSEIFEQITSRIMSKSSSTMEFLSLLGTIIKEYPDTVENYLHNIKDVLDILSFLPLNTADKLLQVTQPLSKSSDQFRNSLILVLRKSIFAKDLDGRLMAVRGFLNILDEQMNEVSINLESEQNSSSQRVVLEILGLLRRCFSQQAEVRATVYSGLGSLSQEYPIFAGDIFELLYGQFTRLLDKNASATTIIKVDACIENASNGGYPKKVEPVPVLLANLVKALRVASKQNSLPAVTAEAITRCQNDLASFVEKLSKADSEDLELDKTSNFDMATHLGLRNYLFATLMIDIYEVSVEYVFLRESITVQSSEMLLTLFKKRKAVMSLLKDSLTNEKGRKVTNVARETHVSLEFTSNIFQSMFVPGRTKAEYAHCLRDLKSNIDFTHFLVTSTCDSIRAAIDDLYCQKDDQHFNYCISICKIYMNILMNEDSDSTYANQQSSKKAPSVLGSIANSLSTIIEIVSHVWPERLTRLIASITDSGDDVEMTNGQQEEEDIDGSGSNITPAHPEAAMYKSKNRIIIDFIMDIKETIFKYLSGRTPIYKEASQVMHLASFLCGKLEKKDPDYFVRSRHVVSWLNDLAKERPLEEIGLAKDIISLLIQLCANIGEFDVLQNLCDDIHMYMGDIEVATEDMSEMQPTLHYAIINPKTLPIILMKVFEVLDQSFDDLTWCIGKLKLCATEPDKEASTQLFEKEVCKRLVALILILSQLVKSVLTDVHAESLFKTLAKAYKSFHTLVKYKLTNAQDVSQDFISVISKAGSEITTKMYKFLTVYGQAQSLDPSLADPTGHKKKGKGKSKEVNLKRKAKIQRESKMIPNLIFAVEQFERHLIQLSRKSKIDFMQYMKRSTSRDFKIQMDLVLQQNEGSDGEDDELNDAENNEDDPVSRLKKKRVNNDDEEEEADDDNRTNANTSTKRPRLS